VGNCIAPPYDVISDDQQEQLYKKSKHNIVRIVTGQLWVGSFSVVLLRLQRAASPCFFAQKPHFTACQIAIGCNGQV
jgi:hypothetical protein